MNSFEVVSRFSGQPIFSLSGDLHNGFVNFPAFQSAGHCMPPNPLELRNETNSGGLRGDVTPEKAFCHSLLDHVTQICLAQSPVLRLRTARGWNAWCEASKIPLIHLLLESAEPESHRMVAPSIRGLNWIPGMYLPSTCRCFRWKGLAEWRGPCPHPSRRPPVPYLRFVRAR